MSVDLTTTYLGLKLRNPVVIAASPQVVRADQRQFEPAANKRSGGLRASQLFARDLIANEWQGMTGLALEKRYLAVDDLLP